MQAAPFLPAAARIRRAADRWLPTAIMLGVLALVLGDGSAALAHGVGEDDRSFIESSAGINIVSAPSTW